MNKEELWVGRSGFAYAYKRKAKLLTFEFRSVPFLYL